MDAPAGQRQRPERALHVPTCTKRKKIEWNMLNTGVATRACTQARSSAARNVAGRHEPSRPGGVPLALLQSRLQVLLPRGAVRAGTSGCVW